MTEAADITVQVFDEQSTTKDISDRIRKIAGTCLIVLPPTGFDPQSDEQIVQLCSELKSLNRDRRLILATRDARSIDLAKENGWEGIENMRQLKSRIHHHASYNQALRVFSPNTWKQAIRTRLQFVGLLSLPKFRIWTLLAVSTLVYLFVFFKLLPSATVKVWPNQDTQNYSLNVYLVSSGAHLPVPANRINSLPLHIITVTAERTITFDQVGKNFTGRNAEVMMTVFNDGEESASLRKGTRFRNQAGMIFRLRDDAILDAHSNLQVRAIADPLDSYGEIVGARGNIPAGLKWEIPALTENERKILYGRNETAAKGGTTSFSNVVKKEDIEIARKKLEQELLSTAIEMAEEERGARSQATNGSLVQLKYDDLTSIKYTDFNLSEAFIGQNVSNIPVSGKVEYSVLMYDQDALLELLKQQVMGHVGNDKIIVPSSLAKSNLNLHIIPPWDDNFYWVKITADLTFTEQFIINPITPNGAKLAKTIRESVAGKSTAEAESIIKNLPQVSKVEIDLWPPWASGMPSLPSSIRLSEQGI